MQSSRGFTLIELMVTIAVIAILAMVAAPSMGNLIAKQQLNKSTRELAATLAQARSQAALLRRNVTVNLNSTAAPAITSFSWAPSGESVYKTSSITSLVFLPTGRVESATDVSPNTILKVCDKDEATAKEIIISFMGTVEQSAEVNC